MDSCPPPGGLAGSCATRGRLRRGTDGSAPNHPLGTDLTASDADPPAWHGVTGAPCPTLLINHVARDRSEQDHPDPARSAGRAMPKPPTRTGGHILAAGRIGRPTRTPTARAGGRAGLRVEVAAGPLCGGDPARPDAACTDDLALNRQSRYRARILDRPTWWGSGAGVEDPPILPTASAPRHDACCYYSAFELGKVRAGLDGHAAGMTDTRRCLEGLYCSRDALGEAVSAQASWSRIARVSPVRMVRCVRVVIVARGVISRAAGPWRPPG